MSVIRNVARVGDESLHSFLEGGGSVRIIVAVTPSAHPPASDPISLHKARSGLVHQDSILKPLDDERLTRRKC